MARKELKFEMEVTFVPISEDEVESWKSGIATILGWIKEAKALDMARQKAAEEAKKNGVLEEANISPEEQKAVPKSRRKNGKKG